MKIVLAIFDGQPSDSSSRDGEYLWCGWVLRGGLMEL